ncbi:MAG TPA: alpha-amylase family glycosyl hydrolase [Aquihabitans sp.]|nr:alpha-amylase family glycosyl hydrolase [Aquihabitans sp.]
MIGWRATYRLQLTADVGFADAAELLPYLAQLGISHLYLSPVLEAVAGSTHGYDGTDPTRVSEERGGEEALRDLARRAHELRMGILLDIVPNHLAASEETPWWADPIERQRIFDVDPASDRYRRFFDIDGLAGVRQEDPEVFERTHAKVLELVADGVVDGLRVDHPDGLTDPAGYLRRLAERAGVPIWVEKILHPGEALRPWPVAGTVGYELAADLARTFTDPAAEAPITSAYVELTGDDQSFDQVVATAKREQVAGPFARELDRLASLAPDLDREDLERAATTLPVYRTYVVPGEEVDAEDRRLVGETEASAALQRRLLLDDPAPSELVTRFQQLTAPVAAKGVEDTAFYRSVRLLAHNEVGADPGCWSMTPNELHAAVIARAEQQPDGLLAATTHDTKRSADTRNRLLALTIRPAEFALHVRRWFDLTAPLVADGAPTDLERWYLFQTLLGSWPISVERLVEHLRKALREAGLTTAWVDGDEEHEARVASFAAALYETPTFWADFSPFAAGIAADGERISVAQTLLRATLPGICDTYQGDETWFLSLTDPDVRRPIDGEGRRRQLEQVMAAAVPSPHNVKLHVLHRALRLRAERPDAFEGGHRPLEAGPSTVVFTRGDDDVLVAVPVRPDADRTVEVPPGTWRNSLVPAQRPMAGLVPLAALVDPIGVGLWERLA